MNVKAKILKALARLTADEPDSHCFERVVADGGELAVTNGKCVLAREVSEEPIDGGKPTKRGFFPVALKGIAANADVDLDTVLTEGEAGQFPPHWRDYMADVKGRFTVTLDADRLLDLLRSVRDVDERPKGERVVAMSVKIDDPAGLGSVWFDAPGTRALLMPVGLADEMRAERVVGNREAVGIAAEREEWLKKQR